MAQAAANRPISAFEKCRSATSRRWSTTFSSGRAPLRPDERPDVGRAAPGLEGRAGDRGQPAERASATVCAARPRRRHRRHRLPRGADAAAPAPASPSSTSMPTCSRSAASARPSAGSMTSSPSSKAMPRRCLSRSQLRRVTIAFGIRNVPRIDAALARGLSRAADRRPLPVPRILRRSMCRASTRSTISIRST